jgi:plastocyanin
MQKTQRVVVGLTVLLAAATAAPSLSSHSDDNDPRGNRRIAVLDDCDPGDPGWAAVPGGCVQDNGDVSNAEFGQFLASPLYGTVTAPFVVGHPSWRNEPGHILIREGKTIHIQNQGGRPHTFTEVAEFGGGRAPNPALNRGLTMAPECALAPSTVDPVELSPGEPLNLTASGLGIHKFQCCFHPWMRATVRVAEKNES